MIPLPIPDARLTIHEVLGGSLHDLEDLLEVHRELFPRLGHYHPYMRQRAQQPPDADPRWVEHWWLARIEGQAAAIRYFKYVPARQCGLSLGIGVRKPYRTLTFGRYGRFSELLTRTSLEQVEADAQAKGQPVPVGIVAEVEDYLLKRYDEYGFVQLPVDYLEPSSTPEAMAAEGQPEAQAVEFRQIALGVFPLQNSPFDPLDRAVLRQMVLAFLVDHYELPEDHRVVQRAVDSIRTMPVAGEINDASNNHYSRG